MATSLVSLGSNLGDRRQRIDQAIAWIDAHGLIQVTARSRLYETQPIGGPPGQASFFNAAIRLETSLPPLMLLRFLQDTEIQLGRTRDERWAARTIDLDLLLYDREAMSSENLTLPHPRMAFRRFVLEPAAEIAAEMMHPDLYCSVAQLLENVLSPPNYVAVTGAWELSNTVAREVVARLEHQHQVPASFLADPVAEQAFRLCWSSPAGLDFDAAIEFLRRRSEVFDPANWPDPATWVVSDFVFGPARVFFTQRTQQTAFRRAYEEARARVVGEKLLCVVGGIREILASDRFPVPDDRERIAVADEWQLNEWSGPRCPTIMSGDANQDRGVDELTAAVLAMHDVPRPLS